MSSTYSLLVWHTEREKTAPLIIPPTRESNLVLHHHQVRVMLKRVCGNKAAGLDCVPRWIIKTCAKQLTEVFMKIFNLSLQHATVPTCPKFIPVSKKSPAKSLNEYRPVALTTVVRKCVERLVHSPIRSILPQDLDPHQFAYQANRSTEDASTQLCTSPWHIWRNQTAMWGCCLLPFYTMVNKLVPSSTASKNGKQLLLHPHPKHITAPQSTLPTSTVVGLIADSIQAWGESSCEVVQGQQPRKDYPPYSALDWLWPGDSRLKSDQSLCEKGECVKAADRDLLYLTACQKGPTETVFPQEVETGPAPTETAFTGAPSRASWPTVQPCGMPAARLLSAKTWLCG